MKKAVLSFVVFTLLSVAGVPEALGMIFALGLVALATR